MGCDLEVDTDQVRAAAVLLGRAAAAVDTSSSGPEVSEHAGGGSAAGREALRMARTRSMQASLASRSLALASARFAEMLQDVARQFDTAEALCRMGR